MLRVLRHLTDFRSFSRTHGHTSMRALDKPREASPVVSTILPPNFHAFSIIPFRDMEDFSLKMKSSLSLLIQISSLRRNNNVFTSVIYNPFNSMSGCSNNGDLSRPRKFAMTRLTRQTGCTRPSHRRRKPFYITSPLQKNPASRENYASELHQVMILRLSRVGRTS